jgi:hypothetical protein
MFLFPTLHRIRLIALHHRSTTYELSDPVQMTLILSAAACGLTNCNPHIAGQTRAVLALSDNSSIPHPGANNASQEAPEKLKDINTPEVPLLFSLATSVTTSAI